MKKNSKTKQRKASPKKGAQKEKLTIGIDLGDRTSCYSVQNAAGEEIERGKVATTREAMAKHFEGIAGGRIVIEAGTHSNWVRTELEAYGHEVIVANPRQIPGITGSHKKSDPQDAYQLALYGRVDARILHPIRHRSLAAHRDLILIRSRAGLVGARTKLINTARGLAKSVGERLPACGSEQFAKRAGEALGESLQASIQPILAVIEKLDEQIRLLDDGLEQLATEKYPETERLSQVWGVGRQTALCYVLTMEDEERFERSRTAGAFIGLQPKHSQSGVRDPQLGISKAGNRQLRWMLVECAQRILSKRAPDSELRQWGMRLHERGGKNAKKRAIVAVARKLAVLLHKLWRSGAAYDPFYNQRRKEEAAKKVAAKKVAAKKVAA